MAKINATQSNEKTQDTKPKAVFRTAKAKKAKTNSNVPDKKSILEQKIESLKAAEDNHSVVAEKTEVEEPTIATETVSTDVNVKEERSAGSKEKKAAPSAEQPKAQETKSPEEKSTNKKTTSIEENTVEEEKLKVNKGAAPEGKPEAKKAPKQSLLSEEKAKPNGKYPPLVFGLDIGTRTIVGTLGYKDDTQFYVVAQCVKEHATRAMIDGQIHDIPAVAATIKEVKESLEAQTGLKLTDVCIAAAGRVLKTFEINVEHTFDEETVVDEEQIYSLELMGVEKGHLEVNEGFQGHGDVRFFCVGYTIIRYYLNNFVIGNLLGHKATKIGADVLATFLPEEVIDSLYTAVQLAGLEVANLTLEPIAAINIAIPEQYRLLNMALVDVGAGTSDISITRDGCIVAYGMIPLAGDEMTEVIAKHYLVDFPTAEEMKMSIEKSKTIEYMDIMGLKKNTSSEQALAVIEPTIDKITSDIGEKIIEVNGGVPVNAVFLVGGGGKVPTFTDMIARKLGIPEERVALRGQEILTNIHIMQKNLKKEPSMVTPIGICLNYYEQKNNFIFVYVNDERTKLYNNTKLNIIDAATSVGFPYEKIFPRRGSELTFTINGKKRMIRGQVGEPAVITLNGNLTNFNASIEQNDRIEIKESTIGEDASMDIVSLNEYDKHLTFKVNGQEIICPAYAEVNGQIESAYYRIQPDDDIQILDYYTVEKLLQFMDVNIPEEMQIKVNHVIADPDTKIYENFTIEWNLVKEEYVPVNVNKSDFELMSEMHDTHEEKLSPEESEEMGTHQTIEMIVHVNASPVMLKGKKEYTFVDIFDFYPFDLSSVQGTGLVTKINGRTASFAEEIKENDVIEIYWQE